MKSGFVRGPFVFLTALLLVGCVETSTPEFSQTKAAFDRMVATNKFIWVNPDAGGYLLRRLFDGKSECSRMLNPQTPEEFVRGWFPKNNGISEVAKDPEAIRKVLRSFLSSVGLWERFWDVGVRPEGASRKKDERDKTQISVMVSHLARLDYIKIFLVDHTFVNSELLDSRHSLVFIDLRTYKALILTVRDEEELTYPLWEE